MMVNEFDQVISGIEQPGLSLAFCDETENHGRPEKGLASDLMIYVAVIIPSEDYQKCKNNIISFLFSLSPYLKEFHATEVVNPKKDAEWRNIELKKRIEAFEFMSKTVIQYSQKIYYCFLSKEQYQDIRSKSERKIDMNYKQAIKLFFLKQLIDRMKSSEEKNQAIIMDSDKQEKGHIIRSGDGTNHLYEKGIIFSHSHIFPGLQLADHAAFIISRYRLKRSELLAGRGNVFDENAALTLSRLNGKVECLN